MLMTIFIISRLSRNGGQKFIKTHATFHNWLNNSNNFKATDTPNLIAKLFALARDPKCIQIYSNFFGCECVLSVRASDSPSRNLEWAGNSPLPHITCFRFWFHNVLQIPLTAQSFDHNHTPQTPHISTPSPIIFKFHSIRLPMHDTHSHIYTIEQRHIYRMAKNQERTEQYQKSNKTRRVSSSHE